MTALHQAQLHQRTGCCHGRWRGGRQALVARAVQPEENAQGETTQRQRRDLSAAPKTKLRLFMDSACLSQLDLHMSTGVFYGVTTNPTILERDKVQCNKKSLTSFAQSVFELGASELQLQSWGSNVQRLSSVAFDLAGIDPKRIVVKLPCTLEGVQAAALLRESNIRVTITGIYSSAQVLLASSVGAEYAAPYLGRMNDLYRGGRGTAAVIEMQDIIRAHRGKMRLLVASLREPSDLAHLSAQGCDTFTISPTVASKMFMVEPTLEAAGEFEMAAERNCGTDGGCDMGSDSSRLGQTM